LIWAEKDEEDQMACRTLFVSVVSVLAGAIAAFTPAQAATTVNCGTPPTLNEVIGPGADIIVNGTCTESVFVRFDDVTISGGLNGEIDGSLTVWGAQRFTIQNMVVNATDPGIEGIWVTHDASANILNVMVSGETEFCAILVYFDSFAEIRNSTLDGNVCGLSVGPGSFVSGWDNVIQNSANAAVEVYQHGTYRARRDTFDGSAGSGPAVTISRNSFLDLRSANVIGDVSATDQSHLFIRGGASVTGNINVDFLSEVDASGGSTITGNVTVSNLSVGKATADVVLTGTISCTNSVCTLVPAASPAAVLE